MAITPLPRAREVAGPIGATPYLLVVVDTEEEFDWSAPFSRSNTSVKAMKHVTRAHGAFSKFRVKPTYAVDYPVAFQAEGAAPLQELFKSRECSIAAHLHPWVNPPYTEVVGAHTSFTCNLPEDLQAQKLRVLTDTLAERFDALPCGFKAGRYGIAGETVALLHEMGFPVDLSVCPRMDFTPQGGPSFEDFDSRPFFLTSSLVEFPCTVDYVGWTGHLAHPIHRVASSPGLERFRALGVLGRLGAVERVMLSPEGNTLDEMCRLTRRLYQQGLRVFTMSYHSPSLDPGHTEYVQSQQDLDRFLASIEGYCEFFMGELSGRPATPESLRTHILSESTT